MPIDANIDWTIDGYQGTRNLMILINSLGFVMLQNQRWRGCCDYPYLSSRILGRPWSRYVCNLYHEEDALYVLPRIVRFQAAPATHERNGLRHDIQRRELLEWSGKGFSGIIEMGKGGSDKIGSWWSLVRSTKISEEITFDLNVLYG